MQGNNIILIFKPHIIWPYKLAYAVWILECMDMMAGDQRHPYI